MTLNDAFHELTIEHVEEALAVDTTRGFPQDVFGLARLVLRTFSVLEPGCARPNGSSGEPLDINPTFERRIASMLDLERCKAGKFDDTESFVAWHDDTRH